MSEHTEGVIAHKKLVESYLTKAIDELHHRAQVHDDSKFSPEENDVFEAVTPKLKTLTYGSEEYKAALKELGPALEHHYQHNSHHPEHYENGVNGMDLFDVVEMLCDWMAAVQRVKDGDINKSLEINRKRFNIDDQLFAIIANTIPELTK